MIAAATKPTVRPGSTMWRSQPAGSSNSGRYPDVGSQPSVDANSAISRIAHPEVGNRDAELACDAHDRVADSRPSCSADQMPAGSAITSAITMPDQPSDTVAGRRSSSVTVTGSPLRKLTPRSPVSAEPM